MREKMKREWMGGERKVTSKQSYEKLNNEVRGEFLAWTKEEQKS